jgi:hypothetical protein
LRKVLFHTSLLIFYETYGSGRPIVMLPGRPSDHHIMERFMEPLFGSAGRLSQSDVRGARSGRTFVNIEQDGLCHALMGEWLDRVEECESR